MATDDRAQELKRELSEQAQAQAQQALEQQAQGQALHDEVEAQGRSVSAFTAVSLLFLPLGFFTQASTLLTRVLILLFLTEASLCSISARATTVYEMALLETP